MFIIKCTDSDFRKILVRPLVHSAGNWENCVAMSDFYSCRLLRGGVLLYCLKQDFGIKKNSTNYNLIIVFFVQHCFER